MGYKDVVGDTLSEVCSVIKHAYEQIEHFESVIATAKIHKEVLTQVVNLVAASGPEIKKAAKRTVKKAAPRRVHGHVPLSLNSTFKHALRRDKGARCSFKRLHQAYTTVLDGREGLTVEQWANAVNPDLPPTVKKIIGHNVYQKIRTSSKSPCPEINGIFAVHKLPGAKTALYSMDLEAYDALPAEFK